LAQHVLC